MSHSQAEAMPHQRSPWRRAVTIGLTAFFTLVDLFAAQAILPSLAAHYQVTPSSIGVAVKASTLGMACGSIAIGLFGADLAGTARQAIEAAGTPRSATAGRVSAEVFPLPPSAAAFKPAPWRILPSQSPV